MAIKDGMILAVMGSYLYKYCCMIISPNFIQKKRKEFSWNIPKTAAQYEICLMNFEPGISKTIAEYMFWNLNVFQIKGEYQFNYLEYVLLLLLMKWRIWSGVKWPRYDKVKLPLIYVVTLVSICFVTLISIC